MRQLAVIALALSACASLSACGLGAGAAPSNITLTVTDGFGARVLAQTSALHVVGDETVMQLLMRNATVTTRYGGGFVQSINGLGRRRHRRASDRLVLLRQRRRRRPMGAAATNAQPRRPRLVGPPRLVGHREHPGRRRLLPGAAARRHRRSALPGHRAVHHAERGRLQPRGRAAARARRAGRLRHARHRRAGHAARARRAVERAAHRPGGGLPAAGPAPERRLRALPAERQCPAAAQPAGAGGANGDRRHRAASPRTRSRWRCRRGWSRAPTPPASMPRRAPSTPPPCATASPSPSVAGRPVPVPVGAS